MTKAIASLALFLAAATPHGPSAVATCWKGRNTDGTNPGLNTMMLCMAANDLVELRVYFPNTPIQEPPTTCMSRGRRTAAEGNAWRIVTGAGLCENGGTIGVFDLQCTVDAEETLACMYHGLAGNEVHVVLEKIFP
jgi:hypothetical protein